MTTFDSACFTPQFMFFLSYLIIIHACISNLFDLCMCVGGGVWAFIYKYMQDICYSGGKQTYIPTGQSAENLALDVLNDIQASKVTLLETNFLLN